MFTCAVSLWDILFNIAGKVGIFSDKRAQGCAHSIRSFKAGEEAGEMPEILFLCCDAAYPWILDIINVTLALAKVVCTGFEFK